MHVTREQMVFACREQWTSEIVSLEIERRLGKDCGKVRSVGNKEFFYHLSKIFTQSTVCGTKHRRCGSLIYCISVTPSSLARLESTRSSVQQSLALTKPTKIHSSWNYPPSTGPNQTIRNKDPSKSQNKSISSDETTREPRNSHLDGPQTQIKPSQSHVKEGPGAHQSSEILPRLCLAGGFSGCEGTSWLVRVRCKAE